MLMDVLQVCVDNGTTEDQLTDILKGLIKQDVWGDTDKRCCIALLWYLYNFDRCEPKDVKVHDQCISINDHTYRVFLSESDVTKAVDEYIEENLWTFCANILSQCAELDPCVFTLLKTHGKKSNNAIKALIKKTCGLVWFTHRILCIEGRGAFLGSRSHEEYEFMGAYLYS